MISGGCFVITGASSGIGAAVADSVVRENRNAPLILVGRDAERLKAVSSAVGGRAVSADLSEPAGIAAVREAVGRESDGVRLLVHSAGLGSADELSRQSPEAVEELLRINLWAPMELTRALMPALVAGRGHVVFVSSIAALGVAHEAGYSATKGGLRAFADALRLEGNVGVTTVLPAVVDTPFWAGKGSAYTRRFPRQLTPEQVAELIMYAVRRRKPEIFAPRWLTIAARVHGAAPVTYSRLARRFG